MISMLLWQREEKNNNLKKTKHSIWFSRRVIILYFIQFFYPSSKKINKQTITIQLLLYPPYLSSKLYFRMWNYYCGKLQLCWKHYCHMLYQMSECCAVQVYDFFWSHNSWSSGPKSTHWCWQTNNYPPDNPKSNLWELNWYIMFVTFFYSLYTIAVYVLLW